MDEATRHIKLAFLLGTLYAGLMDEIDLKSFFDTADVIAESINKTNKEEGDVWVLGHVTAEEVKRVLERVTEGVKL